MIADVKKAKIAIYGAGAMGTVLGALLTLGGLENVHLITRNVSHVESMKNKGATLICEAEDTTLVSKVQALLPTEMQGKYDVVFLMTKQRENEKILQGLLPFLHEDSIVCTTQNGLPERSVENVVGQNRTFGGVASYGATFIGEGKVALTSKFQGMRIQVAPVVENVEKTAFLQAVLEYAGKPIDNPQFSQITENLQGARWSKLAINAAFSGLSVVTGLTFGEIAKNMKTRKIALGILRECMSVANASGVTLEPMQGHDMQKLLGGGGFFKTAFSLFALPIAMRRHKKLVSSMLRDIQNGKKCEIDYIDGVVVHRAKETGSFAPLCERVVEITHGIENGLYEITVANADFFNEK